jgi:uncharacterized protein
VQRVKIGTTNTNQDGMQAISQTLIAVSKTWKIGSKRTVIPVENKLTASDVLRKYREEDLPEFCELDLTEVNQTGNFGNSPLHVAAVRGLLNEAIALIEAGAIVNAKGELGNTPLHDAVGQHNMGMVNLLLASGADPRIKNDHGMSAIAVAELKEDDEAAHLLLNK